MNFFIAIRNVIIFYLLIATGWLVIATCSGCQTYLPQTYRVPLYITQDASHRLPYNNNIRDNEGTICQNIYAQKKKH